MEDVIIICNTTLKVKLLQTVKKIGYVKVTVVVEWQINVTWV